VEHAGFSTVLLLLEFVGFRGGREREHPVNVGLEPTFARPLVDILGTSLLFGVWPGT
jgi:hypothetical protein